MFETRRFVVGLIIALALVGLFLFVRGEPDGGRGAPTSASAGWVEVAV